MRIAYIYPALDTVGGADRVVTNKANYLADKCGYEVYIITAHQGKTPLFFTLSDKVKHIDLGVNFNIQYKYSFIIRGIIYICLQFLYKKRLSRLLFDLHLDIVITTISRDIDFLHSIKDGSIKVAEVHSTKESIRNIHLLKQKGLVYRIVWYIWTLRIERSIKKFAVLVVLSMRDALAWSKVTQAIVIPNSIPFAKTVCASCKDGQILSIGRLSEEKGFDRLVEVWSLIAPKYGDWKVEVYGEGSKRAELDNQIMINHVEGSFKIKEPVKNIVEKYINSSFFVLTSRFEGFGMVLIEAMTCGLPVVAFDCPFGPSDIITDGEDGFLVENGNIQQFAEKVSFLIENESIRIEMGKKARENVQRYSEDEIMKQWTDLFESLKK
jgi:glycosyltransferase involved in cell wall biosynthesis